MKIVTRSGVFETNSSSVHSYTCPIKSYSMKDSLKINTVVGQSLEYLWIQSQDDKEYFIYWLGDPVIKRQLEEENKKYDSET